MCPYGRYIINATKSYQRIILACIKNIVFKVILEKVCVAGEILIPRVVPDIYA